MQRRLPIILVAFLIFISIGLGGAVLGVAWPAMRQTFNLPLDAVGVLLLTGSLGFLVTSFYSGWLAARLGMGLFLLAGLLLSTLGLLGFALAPSWPWLVALSLLSAAGAGIVDAGLNTFVATWYSARVLNWLHASFAVGATLSPLLMTAVLARGYSWRLGYGLLAILPAWLALAVLLTRRWWQPGAGEASGGGAPDHAPLLATLRLPLVWLGIALFFVYAGLEGTAGQWAFTLFTEARAIPLEVAGLWVSFYWGALMVGRLFIGLAVEKVGVNRLMRLCMGAGMGGAALIWLNLGRWTGFLGLTLLGLALAPIFPSLVHETPGRVQAGHAANAIGFQVSAASLGIGALPAFAGILADRFGLEILGVYLLVAGLAMFLLYEALARQRLVPVRQP